MNPHLPTQPAGDRRRHLPLLQRRCQRRGDACTPRDDEATCDPAVYSHINGRVRDKCDIILNNSTGGGVNGDMVRELDNGLWEIQWEERLKGMQETASRCARSIGHRSIASFDGKEILMKTSPSRFRELALAMKQQGIKPEWEVFSPMTSCRTCSGRSPTAYDEPPYFINIVIGCTAAFRAPCLTRRKSCR